ncbi:MAG: ABC transporter permease [Rhodobacterales bacterium RIFCSPHIGHO2_02_FULL_62_130]|jgi:simple sugar transport system permease protein|nr:MAG: ABC transporter permease [Rhodobacterales bacterium RIFCSPHIGHO2_02_FULL_62_130]OHC59906.1 MAG: ABC transporter permease [Rhodobacterales bacterium RIFCSPHIGHO2_12_FULL_62_75]HCZ00234.1 ABC transporter permease [Rhodobacter sp.]
MTSNSSIGGLLRRPEAGAFLGLVAVLIFFAIFGGVTFLKPAGMSSWLNVAANLGVIAIPVGLLMIAGELDISVGAMVPLGAMTVAVVSGHFGLSIWLGVALTLSFGVIVGLINGYMVIRTAVPSLIVTLGSLFAVQGIVLGLTVLITKSTSVALATEGPAKAIFGDFVLGGQLQAMVIWWLIVTAFYIFFVHFSRFGNWIFAMGGDKVSARNAGIPTERLTITLFVLSSTSAAFVGMCQAILYNSAQVAGGQSFIFNAIISVVVGGVLLTGGFGSVVGIFFGTITFAIVNQGIYYTDFDRNWSSLIIGVLLLLAVLMNNTFRKMALSYSSKKKGAKT